MPTLTAMARIFSIVQVRMIVLVLAGVAVVLGLALWGAASGAAGASRSVVLFVALGVPGLTLVIALLVAVPLLTPWLYTRDIASMRAGQALVHWHYDEVDWHAANRIEERRNRRNSYTSAGIGVAFGLVLLLIGLGMGDPDDGRTFVFVGVAMTGCCVVVILTIWATSVERLARRKPTGEIYISPLGIYRDPGGYVVLRSLGVRVCGVELIEGRRPVVRFDAQVKQRYGSTRRHWADVAVPAGREDEARQLVERFRADLA